MGVSALVVMFSAACASQPARPAAPVPDSARVTRLAPGISYAYRWYAAGPWAVHSLVVQPSTCGAGLRTAKALSSMIGRERTTAIAHTAAGRFAVVAAINADFFSFDPPGVSEGPQISEGLLLKSEGHHREALESRQLGMQPVFAIDRQGRPVLLHTRLRGNVQSGRRMLPLAGVNVRPRGDSAIVYTPFWGNVTPADSTALEFVVSDNIVVQVDSSAAGVEIPRNGAVIAVRGAARISVREVAFGDTMRWTAHFEGAPGAREMIGGYPMLLHRGRHVHHDETGLRAAFADRRHPRAAIGVDRNGRVHIVAVDGRQAPYSDGMTLQELGDFLLAHGITDALNLDGGGSTTFVVGGRIANQPSDTNGERAVANALLVIDQGSLDSCARKR